MCQYFDTRSSYLIRNHKFKTLNIAVSNKDTITTVTKDNIIIKYVKYDVCTLNFDAHKHFPNTSNPIYINQWPCRHTKLRSLVYGRERLTRQKINVNRDSLFVFNKTDIPTRAICIHGFTAASMLCYLTYYNL